MPDVQTLLSLFTTRERAESIAGDLAEEREIHGSAWYWRHVSRTAIALFVNSRTADRWTTLGLWNLILAIAVWVTAFLFPVMNTALRLAFLSSAAGALVVAVLLLGAAATARVRTGR